MLLWQAWLWICWKIATGLTRTILFIEGQWTQPTHLDETVIKDKGIGLMRVILLCVSLFFIPWSIWSSFILWGMGAKPLLIFVILLVFVWHLGGNKTLGALASSEVPQFPKKGFRFSVEFSLATLIFYCIFGLFYSHNFVVSEIEVVQVVKVSHRKTPGLSIQTNDGRIIELPRRFLLKSGAVEISYSSSELILNAKNQ